MQVHEAGFPVEMTGGVAVVTAPEEIDITNATGLREALLQAAGQPTGTLVVDMSRTQFCDSAALTVLVRAYRRAQAEDRHMLLVITAAAVLRIFALTGIDRLIPTFPSLEAAFADALAGLDVARAGGAVGDHG
jgi:anti-sigma B factor antagonist